MTSGQTHVLMVVGMRDGFRYEVDGGDASGDQTKGSPGGFIHIIESDLLNAATGIPHTFTSESLWTFNHERSLAETFRCNPGSTR
ncbi:hypothetical protein M8C21_003618, partial [Ambrosia artemisiifolia]